MILKFKFQIPTISDDIEWCRGDQEEGLGRLLTQSPCPPVHFLLQHLQCLGDKEFCCIDRFYRFRPSRNMAEYVADKLDAARHSITGSNVSKIVCKASSRETFGPKKKHLDCMLMII